MLPDPAAWRGKRVLLTGHTGFKGSWAALWLAEMGARLTGFALAPDTEPALYRIAQVDRDVTSIIGDVRDAEAVAAAVDRSDPQIVVHMAAQSLVRRSFAQPAQTFATNVQGTVNLLEALRGRSALEAVIVVTSDKVYANDESGRAFVESDRLGGKDPYSASKVAAELVTSGYALSYFESAGVPVATVRAGNVIGGGDFAADRLVPDTIRAVASGQELALRNPNTTRPWHHVLDCLAGYLLFAEALAEKRPGPRALNFGPGPGRSLTVSKLAEAVLEALGRKPSWIGMPQGDAIEMKALTLDASAARAYLNWRDRLPSAACISWTADWYRAHAAGEDMRDVTLRQFAAYRALDRNHS